MPFKILPTKEFERDFRKLDNFIAKKVKQKIEEMSLDPTRYKHLHYNLSGSSRLRIGKMRVIYSYDLNKGEIYLEKIVLKHKYRS